MTVATNAEAHELTFRCWEEDAVANFLVLLIRLVSHVPACIQGGQQIDAEVPPRRTGLSAWDPKTRGFKMLPTKNDQTISDFRCLKLLTQSPPDSLVPLSSWRFLAVSVFTFRTSHLRPRPWSHLFRTFLGWRRDGFSTTSVPGTDRIYSMILPSSCFLLFLWSCFGAFLESSHCFCGLTHLQLHTNIVHILPPAPAHHKNFELLGGSESKTPQWLKIVPGPITSIFCSSLEIYMAPELLASFYSSGWLWPPSAPSGCVSA